MHRVPCPHSDLQLMVFTLTVANDLGKRSAVCYLLADAEFVADNLKKIDF